MIKLSTILSLIILSVLPIVFLSQNSVDTHSKLFYFLFFISLVASMSFWGWMLIDIISNKYFEQKRKWIIVLILFTWFGAILYFIMIYFKQINISYRNVVISLTISLLMSTSLWILVYNANNEKFTLIPAIQSRNIDNVLLFLRNGDNVNFIDNKGLTPLSYAIEQRNLQIVKILINSGANVTSDNNGWTPVELAVLAGDLEVFKYINSIVKEDVNKKYKHGYSLLHLAAIADRTNIINYLVKNGANIDSVSNHNDTPIFHACYHGKFQSVKMLLSLGANPDVKTSDGETALSISRKNGYEEIVALLQGEKEINE